MIAMPFSGGMDSYVNFLIQREKDPDTIITPFFFNHGTQLSNQHEKYIQETFFKGSDLFGVNIIDALDLYDIHMQAGGFDFIPFRNLFFALYLAGLGYDKILFSFSAEDTIYPDTNPEFCDDVIGLTYRHMKKDIELVSHIKNMNRIDLVKYVKEHYGEDSHQIQLLMNTLSCNNSIPQCKMCLTCFMREISFEANGFTSPDFVEKWKQPNRIGVVNQLYHKCRNGTFDWKLVGEPYWEFLNDYQDGILLNEQKN